jgi:hypothetical protein
MLIFFSIFDLPKIKFPLHKEYGGEKMEKERKEKRETGKGEKRKYKKLTLTKHKKLRDITCVTSGPSPD